MSKFVVDVDELEKRIKEVKRTRSVWLESYGVPISSDFAAFANAVGDLCDSCASAIELPAPVPEFTEREEKVIRELSSMKDLSRIAVLRQGLRIYQLICVGSHVLKETSPAEKSAPVSDQSKAEMVKWLSKGLSEYRGILWPSKVADQIVARILTWPRKEGG